MGVRCLIGGAGIMMDLGIEIWIWMNVTTFYEGEEGLLSYSESHLAMRPI